MVLCLGLYVAYFAYIVYVTDKHHTIDLKHWRTDQLNRVSKKYADKIKVINREIRQLGGET